MFSRFRMYTSCAMLQFVLISDKQYARAGNHRVLFLLLRDRQKW